MEHSTLFSSRVCLPAGPGAENVPKFRNPKAYAPSPDPPPGLGHPACLPPPIPTTTHARCATPNPRNARGVGRARRFVPTCGPNVCKRRALPNEMKQEKTLSLNTPSVPPPANSNKTPKSNRYYCVSYPVVDVSVRMHTSGPRDTHPPTPPPPRPAPRWRAKHPPTSTAISGGPTPTPWCKASRGEKGGAGPDTLSDCATRPARLERLHDCAKKNVCISHP